MSVSYPSIQITCADGNPIFPIAVEPKPMSDAKLLLGITCDRGEPYFDPKEPALFGCDLSKGGRKELWELTVPLQTDEESNLHPTLTGVFLDGAQWLPNEQTTIDKLSTDSAKKVACTDAARDGLLPQISGDRSKVKIGFEASGFDKYTENGKSEREQLWVAHFTTAGEFSRAKSVLREESERVEVNWTPPTDVPDQGMLVRFFFTLRDLRGGFSSAERALCVIQ
jgi:hypothetical protein